VACIEFLSVAKILLRLPIDDIKVYLKNSNLIPSCTILKKSG